jgi:hypothetical protein
LAKKSDRRESKKTTAKAKPAARAPRVLSPREQALTLVDKAETCEFEADFFDTLARAIEIDPSCAEAWLELARNAPNPRAATNAFEKAVEAAEYLAGGRLQPRAEVDHWDSPSGQLYLICLMEAASHAATIGRFDDAGDWLSRVLALTHSDPMASRYLMATVLLESGKFAEAHSLCERDTQKSAYPLALRTLAEFALHGDSPAARTAFKGLRTANKHLVDVLVGDVQDDLFDAPPPTHFEMPPLGSKEEAHACREICGRAWWSVPGAVTWLRERRLLSRKSPHAAAVGPTPAAVERLEGLPPASGGEWELGIERMPNWIAEGKHDLVRPWHITILDPETGTCLDHDLRQRAPDAPYVFDRILKAATRPMGGAAGKPSVVCARTGSVDPALAEPLGRAGVELRFVDELPHLDYASQSLKTAIVREANLPSLADMPGVDDARIRRWFHAARDYFGTKSWLPAGELPIQVSSSKLSSGPWQLQILGQGGMSRALLLTDLAEGGETPWGPSMEDLDAAMQSGGNLQNVLKSLGAAAFQPLLQVEFSHEFGVFPADLLTFERLGLVPAAPEAWPSAGLRRGENFERSFLTWELDLFEGLFRAIPAFLAASTNFRPDEPFETVVETAGGPFPLRLEWMPPSCGD